MLRLLFFFHFHIIELILRRGMGLVWDAEFGGNSVIWSSSFSTWVCRYFECPEPPHGLMFLILISHMFAIFKRLIYAKPECSRGGGGGGGGGSLFFSACVGSRPASNFHLKKYQEFQAPKNILPEPTYIWKYQIPHPTPTPHPPGECSCIVIPGAPVSQKNWRDENSNKRARHRQCRHCLHCHWRRFPDISTDSVNKTIIE